MGGIYLMVKLHREGSAINGGLPRLVSKHLTFKAANLLNQYCYSKMVKHTYSTIWGNILWKLNLTQKIQSDWGETPVTCGAYTVALGSQVSFPFPEYAYNRYYLGKIRLCKLPLANFTNCNLNLGNFTWVYLPWINLSKVFNPLYFFSFQLVIVQK